MNADNGLTHHLYAFIDSGADTELMPCELAKSSGIQLLPTAKCLEVLAIIGHIFHQATHETGHIKFSVSGNNHELIFFLIINLNGPPVILEANWLSRHNPYIDWVSSEVMGWSPTCYSSCLLASLVPCSVPTSGQETYPDLSKVPAVYHNLREVFNKHRAPSLPPHQPYDCAIHLVPGTFSPRGCLFPFSGPEPLAQRTRDYISDALKEGTICHSSSPVGAGFFFVGKKMVP